MRRVIIAAALLAVVLGLASWSVIDLYASSQRLIDACEDIKLSAPYADSVELEAEADELWMLWEELEGRFVLYIKHEHLDQLSGEISKLAMQAHYGEYGHYFSGIDNVLTIIEDIRRSAVPSYRNLL